MADPDAWLIRINQGEQFGSGFVEVNPNSKIPALWDYSAPEPIRVFESGSILLYLAEKFGAFLPDEPAQRGRMVNRVTGPLASQLHERHDASDFDTGTQDKRQNSK